MSMHPTDDELRAWLKTPFDESDKVETVEEHLLACADCRGRVIVLSLPPAPDQPVPERLG